MAAKVVIWLGQSNSQGAMAMASLQVEYKQTYSNIKIWGGSSFSSLNYSTNNNQEPEKINCFGSEFAVLTRLQAHWGGVIYGIPYSVSGTELGTALNASVNWNTNTINSYCDAVIARINTAIVHMWVTLGIREIDFYFIWQQGEQDCKNLTDTNNYQANITSLINKLRTNIAGTTFASSKKIFIIPRINTLITSAHNSATTITGATNASPIVISVSGAHALTTGREVIISGVSGNTAANGQFTITNGGTSVFSLQGSVGNGAYTSGGFISHFIYPSDVATAQINAASTLTDCYSYSTNPYSMQSDNTHFDAQGYEDKGVYLVNNIIIANNL